MLRFTERTKFIKSFISLFTEHSKLELSLNIQLTEQKVLHLSRSTQFSEPFNSRAYHIPQYSERKIIPYTGYMAFGDRW